jgi:hypothetical protein
MKTNKDICNWIFSSFLMAYVYCDTKIDQILTVYRNQNVESKSVDNFGQSLTVFESEVF